MNTPIITPPERLKYDSIINGYHSEPSKKDREAALEIAIAALTNSEQADLLYYVRELSEAPHYIRKEIYSFILKQGKK